MKYLILSLLLLGCGNEIKDNNVQVDPTADEVKVSEEEAVVEEGDEVIVEVTTKVKVAINKQTLESSALSKCQVNKLCRGMTREEVYDLLGSPSTVEEKTLQPDTLVWKFIEEGNVNTYCIEKFTMIADECTLEFVKKTVNKQAVEILARSSNFQGDWIDAVNY